MSRSLAPLARILLALGLCWLSACHAPGSGVGATSRDGAPAEAAELLRVMSFNIRYGTANDGEHAWPARRSRVADRIREQRPDVLAIQEALDFQLEELAPELEGYRKLGQHREGGLRGEYSGLYVLEERIQVLESGEFWLSPQPEVVASRGWDAALPRMAVWAELQLRAGGPAVRVYGTHYDHRGAEARRQSSALILRDAANAPCVIAMGDFNAVEDAAPIRAFLQAGWQSAVALLRPEDTRGTFNGFQDPTGGRRIDHVLFRGVRPVHADILGGRVGELFPSDHDAVVASFALTPRRD